MSTKAHIMTVEWDRLRNRNYWRVSTEHRAYKKLQNEVCRSRHL